MHYVRYNRDSQSDWMYFGWLACILCESSPRQSYLHLCMAASYITFTMRIFTQYTSDRKIAKINRTLVIIIMKTVIITLTFVGVCLGDVSHILPQYSTTTTSTPPPPPQPYSFQYEAGRYPGHVDRVHQEAGDGSGTVHGSYSFVDPKHKVRTVEYTADKDGFHPLLTNYEDTLTVPVDSEAVQLAKQRHYALYERIAIAHAQGVPANAPADSASVERAKDRHYQLYAKIAEQHSAIAAQREAERLAFEATSVPNDVHDQQPY